MDREQRRRVHVPSIAVRRPINNAAVPLSSGTRIGPYEVIAPIGVPSSPLDDLESFDFGKAAQIASGNPVIEPDGGGRNH